jgi:hypothetical protein
MNGLVQAFADFLGTDVVGALQWIGRPLIRAVLAAFAPLGIILGAILNPQGAVNAFCCRIVDLVDAALPATPENLKISNMLVSMGSSIPLIGTGIITEVFQTVATILVFILAVKIYKLIPFKMS